LLKKDIYSTYNGCPYTGNIFTVKIDLQEYGKIFLHKNPCSCLSPVQFSFFCLARREYFTVFPSTFLKSHSVSFCMYGFKLSTSGPAAALAASERPSLSTVGTTVAAALAAAPRSSPPLGRVLVPGSAPSLGRR
jgi:hypothetical protein